MARSRVYILAEALESPLYSLIDACHLNTHPVVFDNHNWKCNLLSGGKKINSWPGYLRKTQETEYQEHLMI